MAGPDYLVCLECDTPTYLFDWSENGLVAATCPVCGNDDPTLFSTEEELEEMGGGFPEDEEESGEE